MSESIVDEAAALGYRVLRPTRMRRAIGRHTAASAQSIPHVTLHRRCQARALLVARDTLGPHISLSAMLAAVVSRTLTRHPSLNGVNVEGETREYNAVNLGVAVAVAMGLVVPVLTDCAAKSVQEISPLLSDLVSRARQGILSPVDLAGGTFTLSNLGAQGVEYFTPIINAPQLAILGVGSICDETVIVDGLVRIEPMLHVSLSIDHAVLDGVPAAAFLADLCHDIEHASATSLSAA